MIYFISDLHLSAGTPGALRLFTRFLGRIAQPGNALYILGDLFEAWLGDDDRDDPLNAAVLDALHTATQAGLKVGILHGNRDFLLGEDFAATAGAQLLPDPYVLSTPEWQFVLSHGDQLCTDDLAYQAYRAQVRTPPVQAAFLAKPLAERRVFVQGLRQQSEHEKQGKQSEIMDVNPGETEDFLRQHGYATFIHGHTHRPARHDHIVDGIHTERWVLADWHEDGGEALCWDGESLNRQLITLQTTDEHQHD